MVMKDHLFKRLSVWGPAPIVQDAQFDKMKDTWVHLWLLNDNVSPPVYLHTPALLDTRREEQLLIPHKDAKNYNWQKTHS